MNEPPGHLRFSEHRASQLHGLDAGSKVATSCKLHNDTELTCINKVGQMTHDIRMTKLTQNIDFIQSVRSLLTREELQFDFLDNDHVMTSACDGFQCLTVCTMSDLFQDNVIVHACSGVRKSGDKKFSLVSVLHLLAMEHLHNFTDHDAHRSYSDFRGHIFLENPSNIVHRFQMRFVCGLLCVSVLLVDAKYQEEAPEGRWLNNERPPNAARSVAPESQVACPTEFNFCLDYKWSDQQTCLHPNPHLIKRCMDEGCIRSPFGQALIAARKDDTYCKDFMSVEGRYCQWTEAYRCQCPREIEDLVYANGVVVAAGESVPAGYRLAKDCVYPTKNMKRMPDGAYVDVPVVGELPPPPIPNDPKLQADPLWVDPRATPEPTYTMAPIPEGRRNFKNGDSFGESLNLAISVLCVVFVGF